MCSYPLNVVREKQSYVAALCFDKFWSTVIFLIPYWQAFPSSQLFDHVFFRNMAIIDNYTVNILINGQPCMESGGPESGRGAKKVIRYIEAISDAPYEICLEILPSVEIPTEAVAFKISIDGDEVCRMIVISDQRRYRKIISRIPIRGVDHSFYFIDIKRSKSRPEYPGWQLENLLPEAKGESLLDPYISDDKLKRIGTILVEVYQCHISKQIPTRVPAQPPHLKLLQTQRKIPEEKIKELSLTSLTHSTRCAFFDSPPPSAPSPPTRIGCHGSLTIIYQVCRVKLGWSPWIRTWYSVRPFSLGCLRIPILLEQLVRWATYSGDTQSLTQLSLEKPQALLSIPRALPIRSKACMEEHLNVTTMQQVSVIWLSCLPRFFCKKTPIQELGTEKPFSAKQKVTIQTLDAPSPKANYGRAPQRC